MIDEKETQIKSEIQDVKLSKHISQTQKKSVIKSIRLSHATQATDSSIKVITSIANTMIGSAMIVFPILFIKDGIFSSLLAMLIVGIMQYATCRLLIIHNKPQQQSFNIQILRILGPRWALLNGIVNVLLLFFVCIGYYLLVVSNLYSVTSTILTFDGYTSNWAAVIATLICVPLIFMKDINMLLGFFKYTIYCVVAFGLFILVSVIRQIAEGHVDYSKFIFFDHDFSNVAGTFALSFLIHPVAAPIIKKNINQKNNNRDLFFGYLLTAFIYFFVGFVGCLTCAQFIQQINNDTNGQFSTVFSCVRKKQTTQQMIFFVIGKIVQTGILVQNLSVLPILNFLTRNELLDLIKKQDIKKKVFYIQSWAFLLLALGVQLLNIDVSIVLSFDGAIIGFFMAYGIPIWMHLKCYHFKSSPQQQKQLRKSLLMSNDTQTQAVIQNLQISDTSSDSGQKASDLLQCNKHPRKNKVMHLLMYGFIMFVGVMLGLFKLYSFFSSKK